LTKRVELISKAQRAGVGVRSVQVGTVWKSLQSCNTETNSRNSRCCRGSRVKGKHIKPFWGVCVLVV